MQRLQMNWCYAPSVNSSFGSYKWIRGVHLFIEQFIFFSNSTKTKRCYAPCVHTSFISYKWIGATHLIYILYFLATNELVLRTFSYKSMPFRNMQRLQMNWCYASYIHIIFPGHKWISATHLFLLINPISKYAKATNELVLRTFSYKSMPFRNMQSCVSSDFICRK